MKVEDQKGKMPRESSEEQKFQALDVAINYRDSYNRRYDHYLEGLL